MPEASSSNQVVAGVTAIFSKEINVEENLMKRYLGEKNGSIAYDAYDIVLGVVNLGYSGYKLCTTKGADYVMNKVSLINNVKFSSLNTVLFKVPKAGKIVRDLTDTGIGVYAMIDDGLNIYSATTTTTTKSGGGGGGHTYAIC